MSTVEFLRKADAALASAGRDLAAGDYDGAANRLYYAMFHAARAALLSVGERAIGRHATIIAQFGLHFCKNGPLPAELGRALNEAQELRVEGDYGFMTPDPAEVAAFIAKAERFVAVVKSVMHAATRDSSG